VTSRWEVVVLGTLLVLTWSSMSQPAIFALIGDSLSRSRRAMGFSVQSIWKRVPIVIAPPIGAYLMARLGLLSGIRIGFAFSLVLALLAIYWQSHFYHGAVPDEEAEPAGLGFIWRVMPPSLRRLLLADCLVRFGSNLATIPAPTLGGMLWQQGIIWPFLLGGLASAMGLGIYAAKPRLSD